MTRTFLLSLFLTISCSIFSLENGDLLPTAEAFSIPAVVVRRHANGVILNASSKQKATGGGGMGMGIKKNGKKGGKAGSTTTTTSSAPFNVNAAMLRLEKKYDDLLLQNAKTLQKEDDREQHDIITTEYVIAARSTSSAAVPDWVPVAQLLVARTCEQAENSGSDGAADPIIQAAVSFHCREICHAASLGSKVFLSLPRQSLQYSVETVDSFYKHVYGVLIQGKHDDADNDQVMTKQEARQVLGFENDPDVQLSAIKQQYRRKSFELHPDRFVTVDDDESSPLILEEQRNAALLEYGRVKLAYETLSSGVRKSNGGSWYQSLGGRARTDFHGPIQLLPMQEAESLLEASGLQTALVGLSQEMVQGFLARGQLMVV